MIAISDGNINKQQIIIVCDSANAVKWCNEMNDNLWKSCLRPEFHLCILEAMATYHDYLQREKLKCGGWLYGETRLTQALRFSCMALTPLHLVLCKWSRLVACLRCNCFWRSFVNLLATLFSSSTYVLRLIWIVIFSYLLSSTDQPLASCNTLLAMEHWCFFGNKLLS